MSQAPLCINVSVHRWLVNRLAPDADKTTQLVELYPGLPGVRISLVYECELTIALLGWTTDGEAFLQVESDRGIARVADFLQKESLAIRSQVLKTQVESTIDLVSVYQSYFAYRIQTSAPTA